MYQPLFADPARAPRLLRYSVALVINMLAALLTWLFLPLLQGAVFVFFYPAVLLSAWYGGLGPGLFATVLAIVTVNYMFLPPHYTLNIDSDEFVRLGVFVAMALLMSSLTGALRRAEESARTQREWLRVTLSSIGDAVIATDTEGRVTFMNAVAEALTGWSRAAAETRPITEVFQICNEHTRQATENPVNRVLREGTIVGLANHTLLVARDGTERPIDDSAAPIRSEHGEMIGTVLVFRDVAERRRAETALRASEERYRSLVTATASIVWVTDASGAFATPQPAWEEYTGQSWAEHQGWGWAEALHPHDRETIRAIWSRAVEEQTIYEARGRIWHAASGTYRRFVVRAVPVRNPDGTTREWIGTITDIEEHEQMEVTARENAERLRLALHASRMVAWDWDPATDQMVQSETAREIFGLPPGEAIRSFTYWFTLIHPEDRPRHQTIVEQALQRCDEYLSQFRVIRPDNNTPVWLESRGRVICDATGKAIRVGGVVMDITDRKRAEEDRVQLLAREQAARAAAEEAQQRFAFLAEMSAALASSLDTKEILERLAQLVVPDLADWCAIDLLETGQPKSQIIKLYGDPETNQRVREFIQRYPLDLNDTTHPVARAFRTGQPELAAVFPDPRYEPAPRDAEHHALLHALNIRSFMCVPLIGHDRTLGVITFIYAESGRHYERDDLEFAQEIARRAALVIDNARLYYAEQQAHQAAERTADRIARLQQMTVALSTVLTPNQVAEVIINQSMAALGAYAGGLTRVTEEGNELEIVEAVAYDPDIVEHYRRFPLAIPTPMSDAVRTQELVLIGSREEWEARYPHMTEAQANSHSVAAAVIPLVVEGKIFGGLGLSFDTPQTFDTDDRAFLLAMAQQCAQALERARLYEAEQRARAAAERAAAVTARLQAVTAALSEALTPVQVTAVIIEQGIAALDAVGGSVVLPTEDGTALEIAGAVGYPQDVLDRWRRFPLDAPIPLSEAVRTARPIWLESRAVRDRRYPYLASTATLGEHQAWAAIPLVVEGRAIGGLGLSFDTPRIFNEDDQSFMWTIGQQCAQALERARSIEALRRSEERFRVIQELSLDAFTIMRSVRDDQGTIVDFVWEYVNPAAIRVLRRPAEELLGRRLLDVLPKNKDSGLFERYVHVVETGQPHDIELYYSGEGITGWFRNMTVKLEDGIAVSFSDITSRKRTEEALRFLTEASSQLVTSLDYDATLQNVAHLAVPFIADICVIDLVEATDSLRRVAAAHVDPSREALFHEMMRRYPPRLETNPIWQVLHTGQTLYIPTISAALLEAYAQDAEHLKLIQAIGPHRASLLVPLRARERTIGVMSFGLIGERTQFDERDVALAEELAQRAALAIDNAQLYRQAQAAVRTRDQFLSIAAHELKNPLTVLLGQTQLLQRRLGRDNNLSERDQRALQAIADQVTRLNTMIGTMLDVSRIETGQLEITRAPVDLCALARQVVEELQPTLAHHTLKCYTPQGMLVIEGDTIRLHQVLHNLVGNAIKYSPEGGPVTVRVEQREGRARVAVTDHGIGIPQQALSQLFQPFYRAGKTKGEPISGMGVGLYVVKEIVTLHGGEVSVESREGEGSTFLVYLPLAAGSAR